jgi:hypothetical protein
MSEQIVQSQPKRPRWRRRLKWAVCLLGFLVAALLVAYGTFRWMASGDDPFDVAAFAAYSLPDEQNAFTYFRRAEKAYVGEDENSVRIIVAGSMPPERRDKFWDSVEETAKGDWSQASPDVRRWLGANRAALDEVERGSSCKESLEIGPDTASAQPIQPFAFGGLCACGQLVVVDACRLTAEGHLREAWARYRSLFRAGRLLSVHCSDMGLLVGASFTELGFSGATLWAADKRVGADNLREALRDVLAIQAMPLRPSDTIKLVYLVVRDLADKDVAGGTQLPRWVQLTGYPAHLKQSARLVVGNLFTQVDRPRWLRTAVHPGKFGLFKLDAASAKDGRLPPEDIERFAVSSAEDVATNLHWYIPIAVQIGLYDPEPSLNMLHDLYESADRAQMRLSGLELALALQLHYRERHEFPASLAQLIERGYLKSIPIDTFGNGEPFRYRHEPAPGRGATLWSIGPDGIDQDGMETERWWEYPGDWVVRIWVPGTSSVAKSSALINAR